jgi:hypothetical protein
MKITLGGTHTVGVVAYILIYANYSIEVFSPRNLDQECPRLTKQIPKTRIILLYYSSLVWRCPAIQFNPITMIDYHEHINYMS